MAIDSVMVTDCEARMDIVNWTVRYNQVCIVWCSQRFSKGQSAVKSAFKDTVKFASQGFTNGYTPSCN